MTDPVSDFTAQRTLALIRAALHGTAPRENLFVDLGESDWQEIFKLAVVQGVLVLTLNGAMLLPKELQPPYALKLRWIVGVDGVEKRYLHRVKTAEELAAYFRKNNIRMLLFKGIALARLYPVPSCREFGDIDIFLFGKAKEGDALLRSIAGKNLLASEKHKDFIYKGILIENHHTFLDSGSQQSNLLEKRLMMILEKAGMTKTGAESVSGDEPILFPPPDFDALYVMLHLLHHWTCRISFRFLCDLTVLFTVYKGKIDFSLYRDALSEAGLLKLADIFISLSVKHFGLDPENVPPYETDLRLENRIWNDILNPEDPSLPEEKQTFFNIIIHKIRLLRSRYWKNELVFPGQFGKKILFTMIFHIQHPERIGKPK